MIFQQCRTLYVATSLILCSCENAGSCTTLLPTFSSRQSSLWLRTESLEHQSQRRFFFLPAPQWGAADAEIKVPSGENTELKRSPFKAWSRSVYSHTCYAYCQGFLPCLFLPFQSIHLHFFQNLSRFFPVLAVANTWFLCRPAE